MKEQIKIGNYYVMVEPHVVHVCKYHGCNGKECEFKDLGRRGNYYGWPWQNTTSCVQKGYRKALKWTAEERKTVSDIEQAKQYLRDVKETFEI